VITDYCRKITTVRQTTDIHQHAGNPQEQITAGISRIKHGSFMLGYRHTWNMQGSTALLGRQEADLWFSKSLRHKAPIVDYGYLAVDNAVSPCGSHHLCHGNGEQTTFQDLKIRDIFLYCVRWSGMYILSICLSTLSVLCMYSLSVSLCVCVCVCVCVCLPVCLSVCLSVCLTV